jgi:hypothetical protein
MNKVKVLYSLTKRSLILGKTSLAREEILAACAAGAWFGLLSRWLTHALSPSAQEMGDLYWRLMARGNEGMTR